MELTDEMSDEIIDKISYFSHGLSDEHWDKRSDVKSNEISCDGYY